MQPINPRWVVVFGLAFLVCASNALAQQPDVKPDLQKLMKTRLDLAKKGFEVTLIGLTEISRPAPGVNLRLVKAEEVHAWSMRWLQAERELSDKKADQIAALEDHLKRMKELEKRVKVLIPEYAPPFEGTAAAYWIVEAEIWLAKEKAK